MLLPRQLPGDPRYLRFNVFIREDTKGLPFTDIDAKAALSPQLFYRVRAGLIKLNSRSI